MSSENSTRPSAQSPVTGFGTNEWLVEEMYQQYQADPSSVDQAWHEFFADSRPGSPLEGGGRDSAPAAAQPTPPKRVGAAPPRGGPRRRDLWVRSSRRRAALAP